MGVSAGKALRLAPGVWKALEGATTTGIPKGARGPWEDAGVVYVRDPRCVPASQVGSRKEVGLARAAGIHEAAVGCSLGTPGARHAEHTCLPPATPTRSPNFHPA